MCTLCTWYYNKSHSSSSLHVHLFNLLNSILNWQGCAENCLTLRFILFPGVPPLSRNTSAIFLCRWGPEGGGDSVDETGGVNGYRGGARHDCTRAVTIRRTWTCRIHWPNGGPTLGHRRRRWLSTVPTYRLRQATGNLPSWLPALSRNKHEICANVVLMFCQRLWRWPHIITALTRCPAFGSRQGWLSTAPRLPADKGRPGGGSPDPLDTPARDPPSIQSAGDSSREGWIPKWRAIQIWDLTRGFKIEYLDLISVDRY